MVASKGAGPLPIPYRSLSVSNLARAITFCLAPETKLAAQEVAMRMSLEDGVKSAVQSFHAQLPTDLHCDVIQNNAAAWILHDHNTTIKLSKRAAATLIQRSVIKRNKLSQ